MAAREERTSRSSAVLPAFGVFVSRACAREYKAASARAHVAHLQVRGEGRAPAGQHHDVCGEAGEKQDVGLEEEAHWVR